MASPLDFNAVLGAQLRDAAAQMRTMRTPPNAPKPAPEEKEAPVSDAVPGASPASPLADASPVAPFSENKEAQRPPAFEAGTSPGAKAQSPKEQPRKTSTPEGKSAPEDSSGPVASASPTAHSKTTPSGTAALTAVEKADATVTKIATPPIATAVTETASNADTKEPSSQPDPSTATAPSPSPATAKPATKNTATHTEKGQADRDSTPTSTVSTTVTESASATVFVTAHDTTKTGAPAPAGAGGQENGGKAKQFLPAVQSTLQSSGLEAYAELREEDPELPLLSEKSWSGGVRGAVLDALRQLAGGKDHVLVNLKRLASHAGLSYGSVRNAMSRLVRSGDIRSRQIRVADGHGVRVEFLTSPGAEGTGTAPHFAPATLAAGDMSGQRMADSAPRGAEVFPQRGMIVSETAYPPVGQTVAMTVAQQVQTPPVPTMPHVAHAFWQTDDTLFALAWPQAAAAGLSMEKLRKLDPVFAVQGFDPGILPRCLRYLDFELEQMAALGLSSEEQAEKARLFVECLQRRGSWPRPEGYEEA